MYGRGYPKSVLDFYASKGAEFPIEADDLAIMAEPTDFLGVNLYSRARVALDPSRSVGETQARTPKRSAAFYSDVIARNAVEGA